MSGSGAAHLAAATSAASVIGEGPSRHMLARAHIPRDATAAASLEAYRSYRDHVRQPFLQRYTVLGFLSSGTYGKVYKARVKRSDVVSGSSGGAPSDSAASTAVAAVAMVDKGDPATLLSHLEESQEEVYAIKKFKPDKESEPSSYTGISQSAMREIALNRELRHENIVRLREVMLEEKAIYMVFHYAEHDFLQLIHHHSTVLRTPIPLNVLKSLLYQLLQGVAYLHANWVLHRDLKPANILITSSGQVKIGDLGLARVYSAPLLPLYNADKVVVTIWYRAPELLLGARHYTPAIDLWAVGCIWGELLALRPMFKGEEAKMDPKTKAAPFQTDQLSRILEVLGVPTRERWPAMESMPDYKTWWPHLSLEPYRNHLNAWYTSRSRPQTGDPSGFELFEQMFDYDPLRRITAEQALHHPWWREEPVPKTNAFADLPAPGWTYPNRRLLPDDSDAKMAPQASSLALMQQNLIQNAAAAASQMTAAQATAAAQRLLAAKNKQRQQVQQAQAQAQAVAQAQAQAQVQAQQQLPSNDPSNILASAVATALAANPTPAPVAAAAGAQLGIPNLNLLGPDPTGPPAPPAAPISAAPSVGSTGVPSDASSAAPLAGGSSQTTSAAPQRNAKGRGGGDMRSTATGNATRHKRQKV